MSVIVMSLLISLVGYLSYSGGGDKTVKFAVYLLLLYVSVSPLIDLVGSIADSDAIIDSEIIADESGEYLDVAKTAFEEGVCKLLCTEYNLNAENVAVIVFGFDFENMRAESIKVVLSGSNVHADWRSIENYVYTLGLGKCEVNIRLD